MSRSVVIGSDESCDFPVAFDEISSRHCRLLFEDGQVWVEDLSSTNGTYVDGDRVESSDRRRITSSSKLSLAKEVTLTWEDIQELRSSGRRAGENRRQVQGSPKAPGGEYEPPAGYAGFWRRFGAYFLDSMILSAVLAIPYWLLSLAVMSTADPRAITEVFLTFQFIVFSIGVTSAWLYFAGFEASRYQATPGKMAIGLKVTDVHGARISFLRATGRHFGKFLSMIILYFGFFMAGWTEKHQALHDMITGCLVVNDT